MILIIYNKHVNKGADVFQSFNNPHDVAITRNGDALYVAEIGPNRVWKFRIVGGIIIIIIIIIIHHECLTLNTLYYTWTL